MDKTKITILIAIVIIIFIGIYFLIPSSTPTKINVVITILDNQNLNNYSNQVIEKTIEELMINNPTEIDLSLLTTSNILKHKINIKMKPGDSELNWKHDVKNTLEKLLKDSTMRSITNKSINDLFIQTLHMIKDNGKEEGNYFILTGSFPECYDEESSKLLINNINETTKGIQTKSKIIWSVLDTRENEEEILKTLIASNFSSIIDRRIIFNNSRECIERTSQQIYGIFFDRLDYENAKEFINYLKRNFGENIKLTLWNDGPQNNITLTFSKKDSLNLEAIKAFIELKEGRWTSVGYLIKQATNYLSQLQDTSTKNLIIIGNFPMESKGNQLDAETWKLLQSIQNLSITLYRSSNFKENKTDKTFIEGLRYYKINFK